MPNNACLALPKGSLNVLLTLSTAVKALKKQVEMIFAVVKKN